MPKRMEGAAIMLHRLLLLLVLSGVLLTTAARSEGVAQIAAAQPVIDPFFKTFYEMLGGESLLGPSISHLFMYGERSYQYTVNALLGHDPNARASQRFFLLPIGVDLGLSEPAIPPPPQSGEYYLGGHSIFDEFVPLYERLMGRAVVGLPISAMHFNPQKNRFEQHFENLGFYRLVSDPPGSARLLAYGAVKCAAMCTSQVSPEAEVVLPAQTDPHFSPIVLRLGSDFTGWALEEVYTTPDGFREQVFGNLVLISDSSHPERVTLRPVTVRLGIAPDSFENPNGDPTFEFYRIQGELGFNVPRAFIDYFAYHGGYDAAGPPISRFRPYRDDIWRQCFLNVCLEQHRRENYPALIVPVPLGYLYQDLEVQAVLPAASQAGEARGDIAAQADEPASAVQPKPGDPTAPQKGVLLQVWERYSIIAPGQRQEIEIRLLEENLPVNGVEPDLIVQLPDGAEDHYYMPPTGQNGQSLIQVAAISAPNGTLIPYQVCVYYPQGETHCASDGFLIGESP